MFFRTFGKPLMAVRMLPHLSLASITPLLRGGYASAEQLEVLQGVVQETFRAFAQESLNTLRIQQALLSSAISARRGVRGRIAAREELAGVEAEIAAIESALEGTFDTDLAKKINIDAVAEGFNEARESASGAADSVEDIKEETRTLLDYAGDLEDIFQRAFGIRFGGQSAIDDIAESWMDFTDNVNDAKNALEGLKNEQQDLAADRSIKEYFLSVAEAYNDQLRAAKLRAEIADIDAKAADNARDLAEAQATAQGATDLTGQNQQARANRSALLGLVRDYQDYITVLAESGAGQDELRRATEEARREFIKQARELGFAEDEVMMYAEAFDDVRTAIDRVPRDITVDFNADPALQALNELNAKLDKSIQKAKELNSVSGGGPAVDYGKQARAAAIGKEIDQKTARLYGPGISLSAAIGLSNQIDALQKKLASGNYASGGYTGAGGKYQPAGIVHRGEYVVPSQHVNQSTGLPNAGFLAQLQNGVRSYANGGFVGGGMSPGDAMMVELSPYDRKLLENAGNVQLRVDGKVVASATNRSNFNEARRGSN